MKHETVKIKFRVEFEYEQTLNLSSELVNCLKKSNGKNIGIKEDNYAILEDTINWKEPTNSFDISNFSIEKTSPIKSEFVEE